MAVVELTAHPAGAGGPPERLSVAVDWSAPSRRLELEYRLLGKLDFMLLPAPAAPARVDGLWRHTCCEAFVRAAAAPAYCEFNFSPSGEWAAWRFAAPRRDMQPVDGLEPPVIRLDRIAAGLLVRVSLDLGPITPRAAAPGFQLGLAAVVEDQRGRQSFWALRHLSDQPDFHDPLSFTLRLDPAAGHEPGSSCA
jgi:hypothetical protein